jgi:hypothetical protein
MILVVGILGGLAAGWIRAKVLKRPFRAIRLRYWGLVLTAFLLQLLIFSTSLKAAFLTEKAIGFLFAASQFVLILFAWMNRKEPGVWLLGLGLMLNFLVIVINGGFMPISPETVRVLNPNAPAGSWQIGNRLGKSSKDIVIESSNTHLWFLSDRFILPGWFSAPVAFSFGDVLITLGAFWLFWSLADTENT